MVILISGASHTGKTLLAQRLLEQYQYPYMSIDLLKMGLIRSGQTRLTAEDDDALREYLWPIVAEVIKTAIENRQNLVVEGCYIPFDWKKTFSEVYLREIKYYCLIMTQAYIERHFDTIKDFANVIEHRIDDSWYTKELAIRENAEYLRMCRKYGCPHILIRDHYQIDLATLG